MKNKKLIKIKYIKKSNITVYFILFINISSIIDSD